MCMCSCHCWVTRCHWAGPCLMPGLQTQLTGWESSRFRHSHILKYLSAHSPRCTVWHQQSCVTRTRPCWDLRDLEKMSQIFFPHWLLLSSVTQELYQPTVASKKKTKTFYFICSWILTFGLDGTLIHFSSHSFSDYSPVAWSWTLMPL